MSPGKTYDEPTFLLTENSVGSVLSPGKIVGDSIPFEPSRRIFPDDISPGKTIPTTCPRRRCPNVAEECSESIVDPYKPNILDNEKINFEQVLNVNVTGVFLGVKHAARVMVPRRTGCIVSTSSAVSQLSGISSHAYYASKHAIVGLTRILAVELGQYGIRVNSLSPHAMFTPMITSNISMREDFENLISDQLGTLRIYRELEMVDDDLTKITSREIDGEKEIATSISCVAKHMAAITKRYYYCRLEGKVALITGAASGVGECTAKLFAEHGAKIVITDIQDQLGQGVCEIIGSSNSIYVHCDVTKEEDVKNAVDIAYATYGKLDIMFNNAGIMDPYQARVIDNEKTDFERVLSVNVTGVFLGMKHAARVMVPARGGSIISMASTASNIGGVTTHAYTCAKHAVVGLTKNMAVELGQFGIRVNCLSPSAMATPMATNFLGLYGEDFENKVNSTANLKGVTLTVDDVAKTALFLVSDEAKYISGQNLFIDGGFGIVNPSFNMFQYPDNLEL
uniref:Secoisolariciresinol dehydrogenase-like n=1 Tax=Tanacetum cinerariifolium TaxID=118510 RepID=A0A6L2N3W3_TANCI|nr:secoisolariciresinol dehydrogenase-like [Tanacetum cinerariifolium]